MFTLVLHWKIIVKGRNPLNNAITVLYFLTFILKHPVVYVAPPPGPRSLNKDLLGCYEIDQNTFVAF